MKAKLLSKDAHEWDKLVVRWVDLNNNSSFLSFYYVLGAKTLHM